MAARRKSATKLMVNSLPRPLGEALALSRNGKVRAKPTNDFDTERFLTTVGAGRAISTYLPKSYIFRQGTKCDAVFYLQRGRIELSVVSNEGKERVVGLLGPGSFIGEGCLGGQPVYLASARASTDATLIRVEAETMIQAIHDHPELSKRFMSYLLTARSNRTWSINCSIRARSGWPGFSSCWLKSDRKQRCARS